MGIFDFFKKKCFICGKECKDVLVIDGSKRENFCRQHLVEKFKSAFLFFPYKMVIFHPEFEKVCNQMYSYYPIQEMKKLYFKKEEISKIKELLDKIAEHPNCQKCEKETRVVYYGPFLLTYSNLGPELKDFKKEGEYLCLKCAVNKIIVPIQSNRYNFSEGLYLPYKGDGIYVSTYL